jgi:hypothetical protein
MEALSGFISVSLDPLGQRTHVVPGMNAANQNERTHNGSLEVSSAATVAQGTLHRRDVAANIAAAYRGYSDD